LYLKKRNDEKKPVAEGTRSYLMGNHQFFFHPLWVLFAWRLEYKSWPKWWEIICIFLHDVGICGRQYLSDDKAKRGHWMLGSELSGEIVGHLTNWKNEMWYKALCLCAGHCPEESNFPKSKLFRADKRSWLVAPLWWLRCTYWAEWYNKGFGVTLYTATTGWKKLVAKNLRSEKPIGHHELYLRNRGEIKMFEDKSGQPRSDKELKEALNQVEKTMLKDMLKIPPNLAVYLGVIRRALMELIARRKIE
jgi:hypothetical protein